MLFVEDGHSKEGKGVSQQRCFVRQGAAFAPDSCTEDTHKRSLYPNLPQSVVSGFEVSIQTISIWGQKYIPFLISSR